MPVALAADARQYRRAFADAQLEKIPPQPRVGEVPFIRWASQAVNGLACRDCVMVSEWIQWVA